MTAPHRESLGMRGSAADDLRARCRGEFLEMPGMRLTLRQAARLWGIEAALCESLLNALVDSGFLRKTGERYMRATAGRTSA